MSLWSGLGEACEIWPLSQNMSFKGSIGQSSVLGVRMEDALGEASALHNPSANTVPVGEWGHLVLLRLTLFLPGRMTPRGGELPLGWPAGAFS